MNSHADYMRENTNMIHTSLLAHQRLVSSIETHTDSIAQISEKIINAGKTLIVGNGGSAGDAQHLAAELVGRFKKERAAIAAIALTTDTSILTAVGNDYGFENVFKRQVEALCSPGDLLIAISTSGNSPNVVRAIEAAIQKGAIIISLTGNDGGKIKPLSDININIDSDNTARIQEMHIIIIHLICELIDEKF